MLLCRPSQCVIAKRDRKREYKERIQSKIKGGEKVRKKGEK